MRLHRILRPASPPAPPRCSNDAWRCERPRRRRRRPVDAVLPRAVRLLVVVSYLLSFVEASARIPRVSPLSRRPGLVPASWARTAAAFLERPVRVLVWSIASRGEGSRLVEVRVARRPRGALPRRRRGRGPVQDHDAAKTTSRTGRGGAAALRPHSRPPDLFWWLPADAPGRAPPIKQSARARGYTVAHIASRRRRRRSPSRRGRAGRFHTSCRTAGLW